MYQENNIQYVNHIDNNFLNFEFVKENYWQMTLFKYIIF